MDVARTRIMKVGLISLKTYTIMLRSSSQRSLVSIDKESLPADRDVLGAWSCREEPTTTSEDIRSLRQRI